MTEQQSKTRSSNPNPGTLLPAPAQGQILVSQAELFKFDSTHSVAEIVQTWYSNFAFVTSGPRDVWIDFMELPGEPKDGKNVIRTVRVFLPHVAAEKLAEALLQVVRESSKAQRIEKISE